VRREGRIGIGVIHSTDEAGELASRGPVGGKGLPEKKNVGGKDARYTETFENLNETATNSGTGEEVTRDGIHDIGASYRCGISKGSVQAHP
jgi:hypothetical protein